MMTNTTPGARRTEVHLVAQAYEASGGTKRYRGSRLGQGAYARAFLARETVHASGREPTPGPQVVVKIYREDAPEDYRFVFHREVEILQELSGHHGLVSLRDIEENFPPTFICSECGEPFYITTCSECGAPIDNDPEHRFALRCSGPKQHVFHKSDPGDVKRIVRSRTTCQHDSECSIVSFLFRPAVFLDMLDVHFGELNELLSRPDYNVRGHRIATESDPDADDNAYRREAFLLRLDCLVQVAEALTYVHERGQIHADLAPENIMVSLGPSGRPRQSLPTRLIDFGRARPLAKDRKTEKPQGRPLFCAPEMFMISNTVRASIGLPRGEESLRTGAECTLHIRRQAGEFLADGDYVWDDWEGEYIVVSRQTPEAEPDLHVEEVTYLLRMNRPPAVSDIRDLERVNIWRNAVLGAPTDIYAFGCVIAWFITAGRDDYVDKLRHAAGAPRFDQGPMDEAILTKYLAETYEPILASIPLPDSPLDLELRKQLLLIVLKCLMRRPGAYTLGRASNGHAATARVAKDLTVVRDRLFFQHRTRSDVDVLRRNQAETIETQGKQIEVLQRQTSDVISTNRKLTSDLAALATREEAARRRATVIALTASGLGLLGLSLFAGNWAGLLSLPQRARADAADARIGELPPRSSPQEDESVAVSPLVALPPTVPTNPTIEASPNARDARSDELTAAPAPVVAPPTARTPIPPRVRGTAPTAGAPPPASPPPAVVKSPDKDL